MGIPAMIACNSAKGSNRCTGASGEDDCMSAMLAQSSGTEGRLTLSHTGGNCHVKIFGPDNHMNS